MCPPNRPRYRNLTFNLLPANSKHHTSSSLYKDRVWAKVCRICRILQGCNTNTIKPCNQETRIFRTCKSALNRIKTNLITSTKMHTLEMLSIRGCQAMEGRVLVPEIQVKASWLYQEVYKIREFNRLILPVFTTLSLMATLKMDKIALEIIRASSTAMPRIAQKVPWLHILIKTWITNFRIYSHRRLIEIPWEKLVPQLGLLKICMHNLCLNKN